MAGIVDINPAGGGGVPRRLLLRGGNNAARNFGLGGVTFNNTPIPKPKHLFFVQFNAPRTNPIIPGFFDDVRGDLNRIGSSSNVIFQIKYADRPKITPNVETLNQYNKKRVIQTGVEYQPFTIQFHDDVGDAVLRFWSNYFKYYYGDGRKTNTTEWRNDVTFGDFQDDGTGWGFTGQFGFRPGDPLLRENVNYFESIDIIQFYGNERTTIRFVRPLITSLDHDGNDYAEGITGSGIVMQFSYEGIVYFLDPVPITDADINTFGFSEEYFDNTRAGAFIDPFPPVNPFRDFLIATRGREFGDLFSIFGGTNRNSPFRRIIPLVGGVAASAASSNGIFNNRGINFGSNAFGGNSQSFNNLNTVNNSSFDPSRAIKAAGVASSLIRRGRGGASRSQIPRSDTARNSGFSGSDLRNAVAIVGGVSGLLSNRSQANTTNTRMNAFAESVGTAAYLAENQNIVTRVAERGDINQETIRSDSVLVQNETGQYALTENGAAVMNSLKSPTSKYGTRQPVNNFGPQNNNNASRSLSLEKGFSA